MRQNAQGGYELIPPDQLQHMSPHQQPQHAQARTGQCWRTWSPLQTAAPRMSPSGAPRPQCLQDLSLARPSGACHVLWDRQIVTGDVADAPALQPHVAMCPCCALPGALPSCPCPQSAANEERCSSSLTIYTSLENVNSKTFLSSSHASIRALFRYVPSLLAVEKWRQGGWWEQTLAPLRRHEMAARLPAAAAAADRQAGSGAGRTATDWPAAEPVGGGSGAAHGRPAPALAGMKVICPVAAPCAIEDHLQGRCVELAVTLSRTHHSMRPLFQSRPPAHTEIFEEMHNVIFN